MGRDRNFGRGDRPANSVLQGVNTGHFCVIGVGAFGRRDHAEGRNGLTVLGPLNILRELVAIGVGSGHLNVNTVAGRRGAQRHISADGHGFTVNHRDGDAVADVEASAADLVGLDAPFADHRGFPSHAVQQELGRDVRGVAGCNVDFDPGQSVGGDTVVVGVIQVRKEVDGVIRCQFKDRTGASVRVIGRAFDAHRVQESVIDGHVDAHGMNGGTVVERGRHGVGVLAGEVRREGGRITREHLEEVRGIAHRGVVKGPIHHNGPLVALGIDGEHIGIERVIGGQLEVRPR